MPDLLSLCLFGYLGLFFPDVDQLLRRFLHHRSIITHSIAVPLLFMLYKDPAVRFAAAGFMLGISVHLAADVLSRPFGFARVWLPWPMRLSLGPLSVLWLGVNALLGLVVVKLILVQVQATAPLLVYYAVVAVFAVTYAVWYERSARSLVSFCVIFGLSLWSTQWVLRHPWFAHLAPVVHLRTSVTSGRVCGATATTALPACPRPLGRAAMTSKPDPKGLAGLPTRSLDALSGIEVAILGASEGSPYVPGEPSHATGAPTAIRKASQLFAAQLNQFDFDLGRVMLPGEGAMARVGDFGDVPTNPWDAEGNRTRITETVRRVLDAGARPLVLGGDDSVPIPVFAAFAGRGPLTLVQVDAHVDWGDNIRKNPFGYGSPMRRASEMGQFTSMVQVGIRGLGSGTPDQMDDARAWGSRIVTARQLRRGGVGTVLDLVPPGVPVVLSIDCDGLDPSVLPAVNMPTPGGLDMLEVTELLEGVAARAPIAGCNLVELVPAKDPSGLSATVAARIALTALGFMLPHG